MDQQASDTTRRAFLGHLGRAGLAGWLGADLLASAADAAAPTVDAPASTRRGILRLRLRATRLPEMRAFYADTLGFEAVLGDGVLDVRTGETRIRFEQASPEEGAPSYHLAWAVPENKLRQAKAWLAERTPLLRHADGRDEFFFENANRTAVYFADPARNVLELIARHELGDAAPGGFGLRDVLYVNHAGLVVDDMASAVADLERGLGLAVQGRSYPNFTKLGDAHRHVVLVTRERLWLPEYVQAADVWATDVVLHGASAQEHVVEGYPYRVAIES